MYPVQRPLHIRQARLQPANHVFIRGHAEADAVHDPEKALVRLGHDIHVGPHTRRDVLELAFAKVGDRPPGPRVDEREHLLAGMRVGAFGNRQVGDPGVERRVDAAVVEAVARGVYGGCLRAALVDQRLQRSDGILRLLVLRLALG